MQQSTRFTVMGKQQSLPVSGKKPQDVVHKAADRCQAIVGFVYCNENKATDRKPSCHSDCITSFAGNMCYV